MDQHVRGQMEHVLIVFSTIMVNTASFLVQLTALLTVLKPHSVTDILVLVIGVFQIIGVLHVMKSAVRTVMDQHVTEQMETASNVKMDTGMFFVIKLAVNAKVENAFNQMQLALDLACQGTMEKNVIKTALKHVVKIVLNKWESVTNVLKVSLGNFAHTIVQKIALKCIASMTVENVLPVTMDLGVNFVKNHVHQIVIQLVAICLMDPAWVV